VLGHADDVASVFEIPNFSVTPNVEDIEVKFRVRSDDADLAAMMEDGRAIHVARWSCAATLTSGDLDPAVIAVHADGKTYSGWLDQRLLRDKVRVDISVVAAQAMPTHQWTRQHSDYGDQTFSIRAGDMLADGYWFEFLADKMYDPMQPPLGSCFRIVPDPQQRRDLKLQFDNDEQVVIVMSPQMADGLQALGHRPDLQLSLVILPALMETLTFIERNDGDPQSEDLSGKAWYRIVKELVARQPTRASSSLEAAQRILEHPITAALVTPLFPEDED